MARNPKQINPTKKHLARLERERIQRRYIIISAAVVALLVFGLVAYGIIDQYYLSAIRPVAVVNGENITTREFQAQTRYARQRLVGNALNTVQFMQLFGSSPETQATFQNQLLQIQAQLSPTSIGQQVLDKLIDDALIRQEAERRGITVTEEEVDQEIQRAFGFFPDGTPTPEPTLEPEPTSTLNPTQLALVPPTATPTATAVITATATLTATEAAGTPAATAIPGATATPEASPTPSEPPTETPTAAPSPTPTPYTLEGFQTEYNQTLEDLQEGIDFSEADLRYVVRMQLLREKVMDAVLEEQGVTREQEQVWARHILVADEQAARDVLERLQAGEEFSALAAELSIDPGSRDRGGDLGWFGRGQMVTEFENAAFDLGIGEISEPVQTENGWHIIQVLGHEVRTLSQDEFEQLRQREFQEWVTELRDESDVETREIWVEVVPVEPTLPPEVTQLLSQGVPQPQVIPSPAP